MDRHFFRKIPRFATIRGEQHLINHDAAISIRWDTAWREVDHPNSRLRYKAYELDVRWPIMFQLQLHSMHYRVGGVLGPHTDVIQPGERQYRFQFILENAEEGGELKCDRFIVNTRRFKIFEPARFRHEVTQVVRGNRRLLNLGIRFSFRLIRPCPF